MRYAILLPIIMLVASCSSQIKRISEFDCTVENTIQTVAVLPFDVSSNYQSPELVLNMTESAFLNSLSCSNYKIIERSKIVQIIEEQSLSLSGLLNKDDIEIGSILNADALIFIKVSEYVGGSINLIVSGRMVETKSGKLISTFERSQMGSQITISNSKILNNLAYELGKMIAEKSYKCKE